jgi:hypothetical protein
LDYYTSGGTAGCPALLVEPSAQNLAWHSETWASGTNWGLTDTTTATGTTGTLDPLGTNTANAISPTTASGSHSLASNSSTSISFTSGTIYTQSAFFKQGTGSAGKYVQLTFANARFTQFGYANFDLQLGALAVVSGTSADTNRAASIENYGNGWYRCRLTATCNSAGSSAGIIPILITASGATRIPSFTGVTGDVLYGWGAQVEAGSVATSYIPTTAAAVTRNADAISLSSVSGCIGQTEGTIYFEVEVTGEARDRWICTLDSAENSFIQMAITTNRTILVNSLNAGSTVISSLTSTVLSVGYHKVAFAYNTAASGCIMYIDGAQNPVAVRTVTGSGLPALNNFSLGNFRASTTDNLKARIRAAALYTTRLTNAELAALTTL